MILMDKNIGAKFKKITHKLTNVFLPQQTLIDICLKDNIHQINIFYYDMRLSTYFKAQNNKP